MYNRKLNKVMTSVSLMLIIFAISLAIMSRTIDFSVITDPVEHFIGTEEIAPDSNNSKFEIPGLSDLQQYYASFQQTMADFEASIAEFDNRGLIIAALLLIFASKALISIVPLSATCLISGIVFPLPIALLINFTGLSAILAIKYWWGTRLGEGGISKIIRKSDLLWDYVQDRRDGDGKGSPIVLFVLRIVPSVPINPISQMYGHMGFDFKRFMYVSLAGYSLKIVSFTVIGSHASNPFSSAFITPLIIILLVSGFGMLTLSLILEKQRKQKEKTQ